MKKIIIFFFAVALFFNGTLAEASFSDVAPDHPFAADIEFLEQFNVVPEDTFQPEEKISREVFAKWLLNVSGFSNDEYASRTTRRFQDVPIRNPLSPYIYRLVDLGVIDFRNGRFFHPQDPITRKDALSWIFEVEGIPVPRIIDEGQFQATDIPFNSAIAPLIDKAIRLGVISPGRANPNRKLTRAQAAHFLKSAKTNQLLTITVMPAVESDIITNQRFDLMTDVWNRILANYLRRGSLSREQLMYGAIEGLAREVGDKHTDFERPGEDTILDSLSGEIEGIGAVIQMRDEEPVIVAPIVGSPAERAGLQGNDIITVVGDRPTRGMRLEDIVLLIKGPRGTQVSLTIRRGTNNLSFSITRELVRIVSASVRRTQDNIAIITLSNFGENSESEFREIVNGFQSNRPAGIVLDMRNNPGGFLNTALDIAGHFIRSGEKVASVRYPEREEAQNSSGGGELSTYNIIVLINSGSASASEILAGALQDYRLARLIGEKSYGKGTVQEVTSFRDGSLLRLTVAEWLTPNGLSIEGAGIVPDIVVPRTTEDMAANRDPQLDRALAELRR